MQFWLTGPLKQVYPGLSCLQICTEYLSNSWDQRGLAAASVFKREARALCSRAGSACGELARYRSQEVAGKSRASALVALS